MRHLTSLIAIPAVALALSGCGADQPAEEETFVEDVATLMPEDTEAPPTYKLAPVGSRVVYGDSHVVAAELDLAPSDEIPEHEVERSVLLGLSDGAIRLVQDGEERQHDLERGEILPLDAGMYRFEAVDTNSGVRALFVHRTAAPLPDISEPFEPFGTAELDDGEVAYEGERLRVVEVNLVAGQELALDVVPMRLVVALTEAELAIGGEADEATPMLLAAGEAEGRTTPDVRLLNAGDAPAELVLFEYRG